MPVRTRRSKIFLIKKEANKSDCQCDKIAMDTDEKIKKNKIPVQNKHVEIF